MSTLPLLEDHLDRGWSPASVHKQTINTPEYTYEEMHHSEICNLLRMNCPRTSNQDRATWRAECRRKLADHIHSRLDIAVLPAAVRLITRAEDPYRWNILTARSAVLFKKQLSKHATGAYIDLCSGVGEHFEAVLAEGAVNYEQTRLPITICAKEPKISIESVRAEEWRERAEMESTKREALEVELVKAKAENIELLQDIKALREAEAIQTHGRENIRLMLSKLSDMLQDRAHKSYEDSQQLIRFAGCLDMGSKTEMVKSQLNTQGEEQNMLR